MDCGTRAQLVNQFATATSNYFQAVSQLASIAETNGHGLRFSEYYGTAKREHENCEHAREALEHHCAEHRC
jgi:hypothetical protein